jgi:hypothetical protein
MDATKLEQLLNCHVDETLRGVEKRELEQMLRESAEARELFWRHSLLHGSIRDYYEARLGQHCVDSANHFFVATIEPTPAPMNVNQDADLCAAVGRLTTRPANQSPPYFPTLLPPAFHRTFGYLSSGWPVAYLMATVIVAIGLLVAARTYVTQLGKVAIKSPPSAVLGVSPRAESVGRITGMVDCRWDDPEAAPSDNASVSLGQKFALASGLMEITYVTGAKVILQGPVTFEVESQNGGFLAVGKLTGKVTRETARGLKIRTPTVTVTDLGTEFGVEVDKEGRTASHVFRGIVEVQPLEHNSQSVRLAENQSCQIEKAANGEKLRVQRGIADPTMFVRAGQLPNLTKEQQLTPFRRWKAYSEELRKDPSLLAYYDFQQTPGSPDVLRNVAAKGDTSLNGAIENATWTAGRMVGKHALRFIVRDTYVRTNLPQDVEDLTLTAWINVHSLEKPYSALLMSDNWRQSGEVHWQLRDDGRMILAISGHTDDFHPYQSRPVFDRTVVDRWIHVAAVYEHATASVRFYLNGQSVGETTVPGHIPIRIGPARIGCWPGMDEDRNFRGRIDEMAIFSRSLRSGDIQRMFEAGKPADAADTRSESTASHRASGSQAKAGQP